MAHAPERRIGGTEKPGPERLVEAPRSGVPGPARSSGIGCVPPSPPAAGPPSASADRCLRRALPSRIERQAWPARSARCAVMRSFSVLGRGTSSRVRQRARVRLAVVAGQTLRTPECLHPLSDPARRFAQAAGHTSNDLGVAPFRPGRGGGGGWVVRPCPSTPGRAHRDARTARGRTGWCLPGGPAPAHLLDGG